MPIISIQYANIQLIGQKLFWLALAWMLYSAKCNVHHWWSGPLNLEHMFASSPIQHSTCSSQLITNATPQFHKLRTFSGLDLAPRTSAVGGSSSLAGITQLAMTTAQSPNFLRKIIFFAVRLDLRVFFQGKCRSQYMHSLTWVNPDCVIPILHLISVTEVFHSNMCSAQ